MDLRGQKIRLMFISVLAQAVSGPSWLKPFCLEAFPPEGLEPEPTQIDQKQNNMLIEFGLAYN